jgi:hypothetical protein
MDMIGVYVIAVAIVAILFVFSALSFRRYAFIGDRTNLIIAIFVLLFIVSVFYTLSLAFV